MLKSHQYVDISFDGVWMGLARTLTADSLDSVFNFVEENCNSVYR